MPPRQKFYSGALRQEQEAETYTYVRLRCTKCGPRSTYHRCATLILFRRRQVEFERPFEVMGGRSHLALIERTTETEDLGRRALKHPTSHIYI